ncbi:MAG: chloride channel protein [Bacteroidales bacterium]|jgi:CIC family chloride channel protein|nr:chloride channel protein [Bacteroidales bacterium]
MECKRYIDKAINGFSKFSNRNRVFILSIFVGIIAALAAIVLKSAVHFMQSMLQNAFPEDNFNYLYLAFPAIGIALTVLYVKLFVKDDLSHGVSKILYAIARKNGNLKAHHMYSSIISSTLTVSFGGSVGLEAPITLTGSAIGSQLGSFFRLNDKSVITLVACGSTAAVAAIFNAPVAGVVFAIEVLMLDLTTASLVPLLISAVTATSTSYIILGRGIMFNSTHVLNFEMDKLPFYMFLGIFTGLYSIYFMRVSARIEKFFAKIKRTSLRLLLGAVSLSILIFFFPSFYGEGYNSIMEIMRNDVHQLFINSPFYFFQYNEWLLLVFLFLLLMLKTFATAFTTGAGGIGGVFAPSLFLGSIAGCFIATLLNTLFDMEISVLNFTLAGMAGIMGSVMKAPLTAVFLIAEISGGYQLIVPLILTVIVSYAVIYPFEQFSVYTKSLAMEGNLVTHHKDKQALGKLDVKDLIENNFTTLSPDATLRDLVDTIAHSTRNIFPLVDENKQFYGIIILDDVRQIIFEPDKYDTVMAKDLSFMPDVFIYPHELIADVAVKFKQSGLYNMAVLDKDNIYYGFVSRANLFSKYREIVEEISED